VGSFRLGGAGVIVAGQYLPADPAAYARTVGRLARKLGWPVLADALSPLRNHARWVPNLVTNYEVLARSDIWAGRRRPEQVVCLHDWPTSKPLRQWLEAGDPEVISLSERSGNPDALHTRSQVVRCSVEAFVPRVRRVGRRPEWLAGWLSADRKAGRLLARALATTEGMFEGRAAALLPALLPAGTPVMVANSMPVRDAEYFWPANNRGHLVSCNRGANGIDGTLSTALGLAQHGAPAVLLTGDLALLHDTNGFLSAPRFKGSLTIVLINNNGGGIFEHLPVAQFDPPFEEFFATPQNVDFSRLAATYRVKHVSVRDWEHFGRLLARLPGRGIRLLELRTDRKRDAGLRRELLGAAALALDAGMTGRRRNLTP
jgi:2-succinyl-5-enolpyruvyl-6-hydroxy-3-cyclohexene-1-carboxylate synthase